MSMIRKKYFIRFIVRITIFILCLIMCFSVENFDILRGMNFFNKFYFLHLIWFIWMFDMILQIIPIKNSVALGSQKLFLKRFQPSHKKIDVEELKKYIKDSTVSAYKVLIIWALLITVIGILFNLNIINEIWLFMISVFFYVCDLICVLIWCPFRVLMKNKCCTTCRIFNWDHLMMFSPLIFVGGFFSISLVVISFLSWGVWELCVLFYPERFYEITNISLNCAKCTDKLCTQYCKKRR